MSQRKTLGSLLVRLGMTDREAAKAIKDFERKLKTLERNVTATGRAMTIGFTAPFVLGIAKAIKAYDEEIQVVKKLEVALGKTSTALLSQAAAIQKTTVYADDQIITIQAWAAALGHSEAEIHKMTTAAVGLASGLGIGLDEAMAMLHKTTLGVAGGLGKLVPGVRDLTKEQLKSGEAINLVTDKFKGFAEVAAKTGLGPLKMLQNQLGDMMEDIGRIALPMVTKLAEKIKVLADWFDDLSPSMKESLLHLGGLAALAGPVLLLAGNLLKLASSFKALGGSMAFMTNPYVAAALGALAAGEGLDSAFFKDEKGNRKVKSDAGGRKYTQSFGAEMALGVEGRQYLPTTTNSSLFGQNPQLIPGYGMTFPKNSATQASAGGGWEDPVVTGAKKVGQALTSAGEWISSSIPFGGSSSPREQYANSPLGQNSNVGSASGLGQIMAESDMKNIMPDMTAQLKNQDSALQNYASTWTAVGDAVGNAMQNIAKDLQAGMSVFAAFGKAALLAAAQVAKAALVETVSRAIASGARTGLPGILVGAAAGIAGISILEGLISGIKAPKLAKGALAFGPTMAVVGDNPNAHVDPEVISPLSKLKGMMSGAMGGGSNALVGEFVWRGDDMHLMVKRAQDRAIRRGSGNVMGF